MAYKGKKSGIYKKYIFTILALFSAYLLHAQVTDSSNVNTAITDSLLNSQEAQSAHGKSENEKVKNKYAKYDLSRRAIDHFMFQFGYLGWSNATGDFALHGFSREFNAAFMLDHAIKSNPHFSIGYGIGYNSTNAFMNGKYANIGSTSASLTINNNGSDGERFKKFKIVFSYVEIPLEFRWSNNIENPTKGLRFAIGLKGGLLLQAHTKAKNAVNAVGQSEFGTSYIEKIYSKRFFNSTKADATFRASLGIFSLYGTYQLTPLLKNGAGPTINPYSIGIGLSIM